MNIPKHEFNGINVKVFEDKTYDYITDTDLVIYQKFYQYSNKCKILEFTFNMENPMRFNIDVLIPGDILNSCVTINNQNLIGPFCSKLPKDETFPCEFGCKNSNDNNHIISTIKPGNYQTLNFKWFPKDNIKFYFYYD